MKKILVCTLSGLLFGLGAWAQYSDGDWKYNLNSEGKAIVTGTTLTSGVDINIPATLGGKQVVEIGVAAFMGTKYTGSIIIPEGVVKIGDRAFYQCSTNTGTLTIPSSVREIGNAAFSGCTKLTGELKIPDGITAIADGAFGSCRALSGVLKIPQGVTSIGNQAFQYCLAITSVEIPEGVTSIGSQAFLSCGALTGKLTIPASVTSIGDEAFSYSDLLESVVFEGGKEITFAAGTVKGAFNMESLRYIDASKVLASSFMDKKIEEIFNPYTYTLVYLPSGTTLSTTAKKKNIIIGELCESLELYDNKTAASYPNKWRYGNNGYEYGTPIIKTFTAKTATYKGKSLTDDGVYTTYLPYETTLPEGVEAYAVSNYRSGEKVMVFTKHTGSLQPYTPYLLRRVAGSDTKTFDGVAVTNVQVNTAPEALTNQNGGSVQDADGKTWKFLGTTNPINNATAAANRLYVLEADNTWRPVLASRSGGHVRSLRAFLQAPEGASGAPLAFMLDEGETTTGLEAVETEVEKAQADIYTIEGRFVGRNYESLPSGLYVIGGKKVYKF